ncbi:MAG: N-acetylmuramoyl-L-alanine amidase [Verrucomicrobiae bacterium]|nr:N-acetylmuramoyl-L-alanine amidase [Verrucomicrobiae bacterium]
MARSLRFPARMMRTQLGRAVSVAAVLWAFIAVAEAPARGLAELGAGARAHVRVTDWARSNGFDVTWLRRGEALRIGNGTVALVLRDGSRAVELDGVKVWLSYPVSIRADAAFVSALDMETAIEPILFPRKNSRALAIVALDPGHGGKDKGYHKGAHQEKKYTLSLARELRSELERAGLRVVLTREADVNVGLAARTAIARRRGAQLFVSLHFNSTAVGAQSVRGAEVYCLTPVGGRSTNSRRSGSERDPGSRFNDESVLAAFHIQRALVKRLGMEDRGVRRAQFEVLRTAAMPAVLVEAGFMSHPVEGAKLRDASFRRELAKAIAAGIMEYKRVTEGRAARNRSESS